MIMTGQFLYTRRSETLPLKMSFKLMPEMCQNQILHLKALFSRKSIREQFGECLCESLSFFLGTTKKQTYLVKNHLLSTVFIVSLIFINKIGFFFFFFFPQSKSTQDTNHGKKKNKNKKHLELNIFLCLVWSWVFVS